MIRLLTAVLLVTSLDVMAQKLLLNEFEDGTPAKAAEVNYNFDALNNQIVSNDDEFEQFRANTEIVLPPSDCSTNQIIKWNGSAWECATDLLANHGCSAGETPTYNGRVFSCACGTDTSDPDTSDCIPPGTPITDGNFSDAIYNWVFLGNSSQFGDITKWCTENVTDMRGLALGNTNPDISSWDTSNVTNMSGMFSNATGFNQDLSNWDACSVTSCENFASGATAWLNAYGGSIAGKTPPLSASLIAAGCGE